MKPYKYDCIKKSRKFRIKHEEKYLQKFKKERMEIETIAQYYIKENLSDKWTMKWDFEMGFCVKEDQYFTIPVWFCTVSLWERNEYILHEITHALIEDKNHEKKFYEKYIELLTKYCK